MIPTKDEIALLEIMRSMSIVKAKPKKRKTQKDYDIESDKDWGLRQAKKNLC